MATSYVPVPKPTLKSIATSSYITATSNVDTSADWYWYAKRYGDLMIVEGSFKMATSPTATGGSIYIGTTSYCPSNTCRSWVISWTENSSAEITYGGVTADGNVYVHNTITAGKTYFMHLVYFLK